MARHGKAWQRAFFVTLHSSIKMTIQQLSSLLNVPEDWLKIVFAIESGNNPKARNPYTNAVGLIQFMPFVLEPWGYSPDTFPTDYNTQLNYVYKYLKPYKNKIKSVTDLYLSIFYPAAVGKPDSFIIGSEKSMSRAAIIAKQNPGFGANPIRKRDVKNYVFKTMKRLGISKNKYYIQKALKNLS